MSNPRTEQQALQEIAAQLPSKGAKTNVAGGTYYWLMPALEKAAINIDKATPTIGTGIVTTTEIDRSAAQMRLEGVLTTPAVQTDLRHIQKEMDELMVKDPKIRSSLLFQNFTTLQHEVDGKIKEREKLLADIEAFKTQWNPRLEEIKKRIKEGKPLDQIKVLSQPILNEVATLQKREKEINKNEAPLLKRLGDFSTEVRDQLKKARERSYQGPTLPTLGS